jgi:hypothetical protein
MDNLFDQTVNNAPITIDETKDYLVELVGEGKKFKDPKDLAKGKAYSDAHIANLEKTLNSLREELHTRKTAEELINQMTSVRRNNDPVITQEPNLEVNNQIKGMSPEDVEKLLTDRDVKRRKDENLNQATQKLKETFGEQAASAVANRARELGVEPSYLRSLAQEAPSAFIALFNKQSDVQEDVFRAPPTSSYRPPLKQGLTDKWSELTTIRKTDPNTFYGAAHQRKLMEAAQRAVDAGRYEEFINS